MHQLGDTATSPAATVLYDDRGVALQRLGEDPAAGGPLWIETLDVPRVIGFELQPQGACRGDLCIPIPPGTIRGEFFNLTAFAAAVGQPFVSEPAARVWSFGAIPGIRRAASRVAPDVAVPDRLGRPVHLTGFRGRKALIVTWASW